MGKKKFHVPILELIRMIKNKNKFSGILFHKLKEMNEHLTVTIPDVGNYKLISSIWIYPLCVYTYIHTCTLFLPCLLSQTFEEHSQIFDLILQIPSRRSRQKFYLIHSLTTRYNSQFFNIKILSFTPTFQLHLHRLLTFKKIISIQKYYFYLKI